MMLTTGQILGDFEILDPLGKGGMGEVHRARDLKLGREVAIKVLPTELARQVNRRLRFEREARILASLNHPNIASIYGFQEVDGLLFLIMELAPGEVLSDLVKRKPLPLREAMSIAREIAAALEYAHGQSVIHRDLKPANVVVTQDDTVKVLDFGLAKALKSTPDAGDEGTLDPAADSPEQAAPETQEFDTNRSIPFDGASFALDSKNTSSDTIPAEEPFNAHSAHEKKQSHTPTNEPEDAVTRAGAVVGTPLYMSPEQARGKDLDYRTDIWAFGCLLYEMLSGINSFQGESVSKIVSKILEEDPDWERLPADTPAGLVRLLRRCLHKDVHMRLQHIGDARIELTELLDEPIPKPEPDVLNLPQGRRVRGSSLMLFVLGIMAGTIISLVAAWSGNHPKPAAPPLPKLLGLGLNPSISWPGIRDLSMAIAPDGRTIAYIAKEGEGTIVRLRRLDELQSVPIPGTEDATAACFSPDSKSLAFATQGELKKIDLVSETVTTLVRGYERIAAPAWPTETGIMFTPFPAKGIWVVDVDGGEPRALTTLDPAQDEVLHGWPTIIPQTSVLLFTVWPGGDEAQPWIEAMDLIGLKRHKLIDAGQLPHFDQNESAIVYANNGTIFVHPFDVRDMVFKRGREAVPILRGVSRHPQSGLAQYDIAPDGTLVYMSGEAPAATYRLVRLDATGKRTELESSTMEISSPRYSPDGTRVAMTRAGLNTDIWLMQSDGRNPLRLTSENGFDGYPLWSPDGHEILFSSAQGSSPTLMAMSTDGIGKARLLLQSATRIQADSWTSDGQGLVLGIYDPTSLGNVYIDTAAGAPEHFTQIDVKTMLGSMLPFRVTDRDEKLSRVSPNGRWIAYQQDNGKGEFDIFVQPYGHAMTLVRATEGGGTQPAWGKLAQGGRELFYLIGGRLMRTIFDEAAGSVTGEATLVAEGNFSTGYDVNSKTGDIIAIEKVDHAESAPELNLMLDWQTKLETAAPKVVEFDTDRTTTTGK